MSSHFSWKLFIIFPYVKSQRQDKTLSLHHIIQLSCCWGNILSEVSGTVNQDSRIINVPFLFVYWMRVCRSNALDCSLDWCVCEAVVGSHVCCIVSWAHISLMIWWWICPLPEYNADMFNSHGCAIPSCAGECTSCNFPVLSFSCASSAVKMLPVILLEYILLRSHKGVVSYVVIRCDVMT